MKIISCDVMADVWNYFKKIDCKISQCLLCPSIIKMCYNISNLISHLRRKYQEPEEELKSIKKSKIQIQCVNKVLDETSIKTKSDIVHTKEKEAESRPCDQKEKGMESTNLKSAIQRNFAKIKSFSEGGSIYNDITTALLYFICRDYQPISIVCDEGFQHLFKKHAPLYKIPTREKISVLIDKKYKELTEKLIVDIKNELVTLSTDVWTDTFNTRSYLGMTLHYLYNFDIKSVDLGIFQLDEAHTSQYLTRRLQEILKECNIKEKNINVVVADNRSNIKKQL